MDLTNLKPAKGAVKKEKRVGRGEGSTRGGTSTRGHKGAKSRSGYSEKRGFEGGQMPLQRRLPKFGFKNINKKEYKAINLETLQSLADTQGVKQVDFQLLIDSGLASNNQLIKVLGKGKLSSKLEVKAHAFSKSAVEAIVAAGGVASVIE